jgi:hypothetical protein
MNLKYKTNRNTRFLMWISEMRKYSTQDDLGNILNAGENTLSEFRI